MKKRISNHHRTMLIVGHESAIQQFRITTINELRSQAIDPHVLVTGHKLNGLDFLDDLSVSYTYLGFSHLSKNPFLIISYIFKMARQISAIKPNSILVRNAQGLAFLRWSRLLSMQRPKVVALVEGLGQANSKLGLLLWRLAFVAYKDVILLNDDDFEDLNNAKVLTHRNSVQVVKGIGVELDKFPTTPFPNEDAFQVVMISRLISEKGVKEYLEAAKQLAEHSELKVNFVLIGDFTERPEIELKEMIEAYDQAGYISFVGPQNDVRPFFAASHLHILPSYYREGWPATVMEAAAMGRASIVTSARATRCCVSESTGWKIPPNDSNALANCIKHALTSGAYRTKGKAATDFTRNNQDRTGFDKLVANTLQR